MSWWAAYCEAKRELLARDSLRALGLDVFCPFERVVHRRKQVRRNTYLVATTNEPLFPRYLFVDGRDAHEVRSARGVIALVRDQEGPLEVPGRVVEGMRALGDADGLIKIRDLSKRSSTFHAQVDDRFTFKLGSSFGGMIGRIASLADLDDTGVVHAWVEFLGSQRTVAVKHSVIGPLVAPARPGAVLGGARKIAVSVDLAA